MYRAFLIAAASAVVLGSCSENEIENSAKVSDGCTPMTFSTYLPGHTRGLSSVADIQTLAESGFKLYATYDNGGTATTLLNEKFSVDASTGVCSSTSGEQPYWPSDKSDTVCFIGMYPSNYFIESNLAKNGEEQYELKVETAGNKDVLVACVTQSEADSEGGNVSLTFKHVMAHAILKVSSADAADYAITLTQADLISVPASSTLNCSTGAIVADAAETTSFFFTAEAMEVAVSAGTIGSVMVPASGSTGTEVGLALTYVYDYGNDVVRTYKDTAYVTLVAGYQNNINVTVSGDKPLVVSGTIDEWIARHDYVDLGLPSGLLWATCNIGAESPEEYGNYFAWGETVPNINASWGNYSWCDGTMYVMTKYCATENFGTVDDLVQLELDDDAAHVIWGGSWRMPTSEEYAELINSSYTTREWTTFNDVNGILITSKANGNSIFLPAAGYYSSGKNSLVNRGQYWSSSLYTASSSYARFLEFYDTFCSMLNNTRVHASSIRPVREREP